MSDSITGTPSADDKMHEPTTTLRTLRGEAATADVDPANAEETIGLHVRAGILDDDNPDRPLTDRQARTLRLDTFPPPPTSLPCPPWCDRGTGHPFDGYDPGTLHVIRSHSSTITDDAAFTVELAAMETATTHEGPIVETCPLELCIYVAGDSLTGPAARDLAAALVQAADAWDSAGAA